MKKIAFLALTVILAVFFLTNCGESDVAEVKSLATYEDPAVKFSIKYPENWVTFKQPTSRFIVYSSKGVKQRYPSYEAIGTPGVKIEILVTALDSTKTIDSVINNRLFETTYYSDIEKVTVDGVQGFKQTYGFDLEDGPFYGEVIHATKDNQVVTSLYIEAFAGTFAEYQKYFDEIVASFKLAYRPVSKQDTVFEEVEADPPSTTLRTASGDGYSIDIPDNFSKEKGLYMGMRRGDSYIKVDVTDASKTKDFGKLVEENRKKLPGASSASDLSLGGDKAKKVSYTPSGKVAGEIYFVLKGGKLYRITLNWFKGDAEEEKLFKPIFQKCVMTFKAQ